MLVYRGAYWSTVETNATTMLASKKASRRWRKGSSPWVVDTIGEVMWVLSGSCTVKARNRGVEIWVGENVTGWYFPPVQEGSDTKGQCDTVLMWSIMCSSTWQHSIFEAYIVCFGACCHLSQTYPTLRVGVSESHRVEISQHMTLRNYIIEVQIRVVISLEPKLVAK